MAPAMAAVAMAGAAIKAGKRLIGFGRKAYDQRALPSGKEGDILRCPPFGICRSIG